MSTECRVRPIWALAAIAVACLAPAATHAQIEIASIEDLQKIGNDEAYPLDGDYVLTQDIDASETVDWNGGEGFEPIGSEDTPFTGVFDGRGHVIDGLAMRREGRGPGGPLRQRG